MNRAMMLLIAVSIGLLVSTGHDAARADEWTSGPWEVYTGIENLGDVTKTSPAEDDLHYSGNGNPDYAYFSIDTSNVEEKDRRAWYCDGEFQYYEYWDVGLHAGSTNWICSAGSIVDGGFSTTYTPPSTPMSGITVKVRVYDSLSANTNDPYKEKQYPNTLKAFKVGVHLSTSPTGTSYKKWEDGTTEGSVPTEDVSTNVNVSGNDSDRDDDSCSGTWTLITDPDGCNMRGVIRGYASTSADGCHSLYAADTDWLDGGGGSFSVTVNLLIFSWTKNWDLDDSTMAIVSSAIGLGSDVCPVYEETGLTLVSTDFNEEDCYESQNIGVSRSGSWTGKEGSSRQAQWITKVECETKVSGSQLANGQGGASADCDFDIPTNPSYQ